MRLTLLAPALLALASLSAACGESDDAGGGTRTLWVSARAETDGSVTGTYLVVSVRDGSEAGDLVTDAEVVLRGEKNGQLLLPWQEESFAGFRNGAYVRSAIPWDTGWQLEISRGGDRLDAFLKTPGLTQIIRPVGGTTYSRASGRPLMVEWTAKGERADRIQVSLERADQTVELTEDDGEVSFDAGQLEVGEEDVTVRRANRLELNGGVVGSTFEAASRITLQFRVE